MSFESYYEKHYSGDNEGFKSHLKNAYDAAIGDTVKVFSSHNVCVVHRNRHEIIAKKLKELKNGS